jgi:hypothetical protein
MQGGAGTPDKRSYYARTYVGLGDALAKDGEFDGARRAWQDGLDAFPGNLDLEKRLALKTAADARAFVEKTRNLEEQIDTDFSFVVGP